jgi:peptide methionine sulfoxide reductase msrA/msrB
MIKREVRNKMKKSLILIILFVALVIVFVLQTNFFHKKEKAVVPKVDSNNVVYKTAVFANGCFWCVEHDLEEVKGVKEVISGYSGGIGENPSYENYSEKGYREVVQVSYDESVVRYSDLVEHILRHGDPTDSEGSFVDRGIQYSPAIYFENDIEKKEAEQVIQKIKDLKVFDKEITIPVIKRVAFWPAEEYHQDYSKKNPLRYNYYRSRSGRDDFLEKVWKDHEISNISKSYKNFVKPSKDELKKILTPIQFDVTQNNGTERPFNNEYDKNFEKGIYVDIVSGEPLYLSKDKFDSGTGWPSFVKPISDSVVVLKEDNTLFSKRIEVRSRIADSHLGHVFDDGPKDRGGKRYCMNSASLRFVPIADMEKQGYGEFVELIK